MRFLHAVLSAVLFVTFTTAATTPRSAVAQRILPPPPEVIPDTSYGSVPYDLDLLALDGSRRSLAEFRDRVLFINFWATWCAPCLAELPSIEALERRLGVSSVEVLLISTDDDPAVVRQFLEKEGISGQVFVRDWEAGESPFRRVVIPTTYVISKAGEITYRHSGAANWNVAAMASYLKTLAED